MDFLPIIPMPFEISGEKVAGTNDAARPAPPDELNDNVIVFLNTASGGRMGPKVLEKVRGMIPESQIFDLDDVKQKKWIPEDKLRLYENVGDIKVLICGGDGTMGWILSCIDRMIMSNDSTSPDSQKFPVAMMPLGTGNDLARSFGWGPGFSASMLRPKFIEKVKKAPPSKLDRWLLSVMPYTPLGDDEIIKNTDIPPTFSVHKYSSALSPLGNHFGPPQPQDQQERRTQSVLRIGRSFSVRMSSVANAVHEKEMNHSSSVGRRSFHAAVAGAESENGGDSKEAEAMVRASSAPTAGEEGPSASALLSALGYASLNENDDEEDGDEEDANEARAGEDAVAPSSAPPQREEEAETDDTAAATGGKGQAAAGEGKEAAATMREDRNVPRKGPPPRSMPSISVIQRYETWESYDAVFFNYFSFGVDAVAASAFHEFRKEYPQLFTSRFRNQTWYARKGFPAAGGVPCSGIDPPPLINKYLKMNIKRTAGSEWEEMEVDENLRGMVVLNLQSYGGGRDLWGSAKPGCSEAQVEPAAPDDGLLEIVGIGSILELGCIMGLNSLGVGATRLCQVAEVELRMHSEIHMQIDGEPWLQAPAKVNIKHYGQSTCLRGPD